MAVLVVGLLLGNAAIALHLTFCPFGVVHNTTSSGR